MKKILALLLAMLLVLGAGGCGKQDAAEEKEPHEIQTEFTLAECGLSYTIPDAWVETENSNLIPVSFVKADGEIYAKIQYNYAPDENMADLSDTTSTVPVEELMTPIAELLVVKEENLETEAVTNELALFNNVEEIGTEGAFHFYFLTDYASGIEHFPKDAQETFRSLEEALPALRESIQISLPDEQAVREAAEENSKYLNFISNTLEGDPITTTVFYDYDMTVVNFWASYCEEEGINELEELESFYQELQKTHPNVNFVQVIIDTPGEKAESIVAKAYEDAGVTFTGIMPDQNLAGWIVNNLEGLPTTVFVDKKGKAAEFQIQGMQDADYYMETTETMMKTVGKAE